MKKEYAWLDYEEFGVPYRKYYNGPKNIPKMIYLDDLVIHDGEEMTVEEYVDHVRFERIRRHHSFTEVHVPPGFYNGERVSPPPPFGNDEIKLVENVHIGKKNPFIDISDDALVDNESSDETKVDNESNDETNNQSIIDSTMFDEDIDWDVIIPDGFTEIPERMFYSCKEIHNVYLPDGIKKIGDYAFAFCGGLMHIRIPSSIEIIGAGAFNYCDSLKELIIPRTIKKIGKSAFSDCDNASIRFV